MIWSSAVMMQDLHHEKAHPQEHGWGPHTSFHSEPEEQSLGHGFCMIPINVLTEVSSQISNWREYLRYKVLVHAGLIKVDVCRDQSDSVDRKPT